MQSIGIDYFRVGETVIFVVFFTLCYYMIFYNEQICIRGGKGRGGEYLSSPICVFVPFLWQNTVITSLLNTGLLKPYLLRCWYCVSHGSMWNATLLGLREDHANGSLGFVHYQVPQTMCG